MRGLLIALAIASAVMIVQGYARSEQVMGGSYLARVDQVIVEMHPGIYSPPAGRREDARHAAVGERHLPGAPRGRADVGNGARARVPAREGR